MRLLLDTGVLGRLCHSSRQQYVPLRERLDAFLALDEDRNQVVVPEIADYELRRKLLHLAMRADASYAGVDRLDQTCVESFYLPIDTDAMQTAAELWARARHAGRPTAPPQGLDADVILAAQAIQIGGTVVTTNRKHLSQFVPTMDWTEIPTTA